MLKLRLREIRQSKRLTLAQVAAQVGASIPHVSELERGKKRINNDWLRIFAEFYDVPVRSLFVDEASADIAETLLTLEDLEADDVARVRSFAEALARSKQADEQA